MDRPRTCGGGCCSPVVDKPIHSSSLPVAPASEEGCRSSGEMQDTCHTTPEPRGQPATTLHPIEGLAKTSCGAPCCGGKLDEAPPSLLPPGLPIVPAFPFSGRVDSDGSASPGPSSCQATICDDKCGHVVLTPKQELDDLTAGRRQLVLAIQGMDCPGCSPRVVRALTSFSSVADCHVDVFAGRATVSYHPGKAQPDEMARHVVASTGFQCQVEDDQVIGKDIRRMRVQLSRPLGGERPKLEGVQVIDEKASGLVEVEYETDINPRDVLASFVPWDGVYVPPSRESGVDSAQREVVRLLRLTVFSAILTLPVLVLAWAPLPPRPTAYGAVSLAMTTIIQVVVARPIYVSGLRALLVQYTIDMDLLVSLSIGTAYIFSTVAYACAVAGRPIKDGESYFETAALLVTLVMLGRLIAAYARRRSTNAVSKLGSMQSSEATLVEKINGQEETRVIPVGLVHMGDILRIQPGAFVPTDGKVVDGEGFVDESSISGESRPILKSSSSGATERVLIAGTTLVSCPTHMDMRVTVTPDGNTISRMAQLMRTAQSARLRVQDTTDRVAGWFAPIALTIAIVAFVGWIGIGVRNAHRLPGSERSGGVQKAVVDAIGYAVAILVVSCPCALAICVPMVAVIAVASVEALENACDVKVVVFDKTGTLTLGKPGIESSTYYTQAEIPVANSEESIQRLVHDLTVSSTHPVAVAIHGNLSALIPPTEPTFKAADVRSIPGKGLEVIIDGYLIRGGNAAWTTGDGISPPISSDHTVFIVSIAPNSPHPKFTRIAYYTLSDTLRPDSLKTVQELTDRGLEVHILSGDAPGVVAQTAASLGIPTSQARGGCSPEEKAQWVKFLQTGGMGDGGECGSTDLDKCCSSTPPTSTHKHEHGHGHGHSHKSTANGRKVMFIGDGTNDALALVQSDVSISLGTGTDIASSAANIVLLSSLSTGLSTVFTLARAARTRIWINFGWAFVYNVVAILLASGVLGSVRIPPEWAGLGELVNRTADSADIFIERLGNCRPFATNMSGDLVSNENDSKSFKLFSDATDLWSSFLDSGSINDLNTGIEYLVESISLLPDGDPRIPGRLDCLNSCYRTRFDHLENIEDLTKMIECTTQMHSLTLEDDPNLPNISTDLGLVLLIRFRTLGDMEDLNKAVDYFKQSSTLTSEGDSNLPYRLGILSTAYFDRHMSQGDLEDLNLSIEHAIRAHSLTPEQDPDLAERLTGLCISYGQRFQRLRELSDVDKAIDYGIQSCSLTPRGDALLPKRLLYLGIAYHERYVYLGDLDDLNKSIEHKRHAHGVAPSDHPDLPHILCSLGASYHKRFSSMEDPGIADINQAIQYQEQAKLLLPEGHPDTHRWLSRLGSAYHTRSRHLNSIEDLNKAIENSFKAHAITPVGDPSLTWQLSNIGALSFAKFERLGGIDDLNNAIEYHKLAYAAIPAQHPDSTLVMQYLSRCYEWRFKLLRDDLSLNTAIDYFRQSTYSTGYPNARFEAALDWARFSAKNDIPNHLHCYQVAIELIPEVIWVGITVDHRYKTLGQLSNVAIEAASVAIASNRLELALEWLEQGRSIVWNQALLLRSPLDELRERFPTLADELEKTRSELHYTSSRSRPDSQDSEVGLNLPTSEQVAQRHHHLAKEYADQLLHIRKLPGFSNFMKSQKAIDLVGAARVGPVIVVICHESRCDALIIYPGDSRIIRAPLHSFTNKDARKLRSELGGLLANDHMRQRGFRTRQQPIESQITFEDILASLWNNVVKPILDLLQFKPQTEIDKLPQITWCTTGELSFLPLHAAGEYDKTNSSLFDYAISAYAPTLTALFNSRPSSSCQHSSLLAIGQEATPGHSWLPGTVTELAYIRNHINTTIQHTQLVNKAATTSVVLEAMEQHDWVHLSCHASQNARNPTRSGFFLHDGTLDLMTIMRKSFKNKGLAFLSACQTARGDENLPDEAVHLASGLLTAGYTGVIASMWAVDDRDAPLIADKVYGRLLKDGKMQTRDAAKALHMAVLDLRETIGVSKYSRWTQYIYFGS
ncbi:unnamed protein product [Rhizoctonia solani]|uniref:HMA domain-containing protein n=1 Tax=Rhizoctonia solani TaxID=456999 RepID=A0A8H3HX51_9AGAM|nr:unnamed protein product [Rhizoctonia solani]